jgi:hypothetical protein
MSTISGNQRFILQTTESFTAVELPELGEQKLTYDAFNKSVTLSPTTTPPATKSWAKKLTGSQTLDLTALTRTLGATVNATGLRLQSILVNNLSTTDNVVIAKGVSNGYAFNGAAGNKTIVAGGSFMEFFNDGLTDIDATHKTLDITAVGDFQIILVCG